MNDDLKSFYTAIILSALVVLGVNYFMPKDEAQTEIPTEVAIQTETESSLQSVDEEAENIESSLENTIDSLAKDVRVSFENNVLSGSIRLKGLRFDNLTLNKYKQTLDNDSPNVELFAPAKTANAYFTEFGWLSNNSNLNLPDAQTIWNVVGNNKLSVGHPLILEWNNGQGLKFTNTISVDENYLFEIKQTVTNNSGEEISLIPYGLFSKTIDPTKATRSVVHEGLTGAFNDKLKEIRYQDIKEKPQSFETTGGWVSFADKYWFSSFVFNDTYQAKVNVRKVKDNVYQLDYRGPVLKIQSGSSASVSTNLYAGAKEIKLLDKYADKIKKFDLNVDFGWYYFLTKPFFYALDFLYGILGNMGWAILLFAAILRLLMFPIANKSYVSMSKMKKIQPKVMALQTIYKDDKQALQRATMELYKKEKVNPASGCLPMFIQIPIFFSLYKVLNIAIEIRHAPFIGWVKDLSAPDSLTISSWSHIPHIPSMLDIGVWPLIYGLTMLLQNKLNPKPANKDQARMFMLMPIVFTIMFAHFAVGLVIYWILNNVLSLIQQKIIMYKNGVK